MTSHAEFFDQLEAKIDDHWDGIETQRLWWICKYSPTRYSYRAEFSNNKTRRRDHLRIARENLFNEAKERITG